MEFKKFMSLGVKTEEGVLLTKYLNNINKKEENNVLKIKDLFETHGYDLSIIPGAFLKIFTLNDKEISELEKSLTRIDELGLTEIISTNLKVATFKPTFVGRLEYCLNNNVPFLNEDNSIVSMLYNSEVYAQYTAKATPIEEVKTVQEIEENPPFYDKDNIVTLLDEEDLIIQKEIIKTLTEINRENKDDMTLKFIISTIIANLDSVIANDNKNYRFMGTEHIIEIIKNSRKRLRRKGNFGSF